MGGDVTTFNGLGKAPANSFAHALRWYNHISSFGAEKSKFPVGTGKISAPAKMERQHVSVRNVWRLMPQKKIAKPGPIAKSQIMLDVKPWDDETDMKAMEDCVRTIEMDGLKWGASKLNPVGFGIQKLSIICVVEDAKVSVDDLSEKITEFEDYVQSVDVAAFNKV